MRLAEQIKHIFNPPVLCSKETGENSDLKKTIASLKESIAAKEKIINIDKKIIGELLIERNAAYNEIARLKTVCRKMKRGGK